jgi:hypothetical protein
MTLRHLLCKVSAVLKMHRADCNHCNALQECWGLDMPRRLAELSKQEAASELSLLAQSEMRSTQSSVPTNIASPYRKATEESLPRTG